MAPEEKKIRVEMFSKKFVVRVTAAENENRFVN